MNDRKFLVIGLDCASPELVFNEFKKDLPNLSRLAENGVYGTLQSCMPPITVPAWLVMFTGKNAGNLGIYGFRHRKDNSYSDIWITNSRSVKERTLWNIFGNKGKKSCLVGIPPSYPPSYVNGWLVSCFLTPSSNNNYTFPDGLKAELEESCTPYIPDIELRTGNLAAIRKQVFQMLDNHMEITRYLLKEKPWDFFVYVDIGVDRVQHAFWRYFDRTHTLYQENNEFKHVIRDYYKAVDNYIGELLELIDKDTFVLVASDHGAKAMKGTFCINEWLVKENYLVLNQNPKEPTKILEADINWDKTKAWAWGGYYSRIFLNIKGRERNGIIDPKDYSKEINLLKEKLLNLKDHTGQVMDNIVVQPEDLYNSPKGNFPDLMVIYDDLFWRAAGTIGNKSLFIFDENTASGGAMHNWNGMFILYDPKFQITKGKINARIEDITPTILYLMDEDIPKDLDGKVINNVKQT
jgi:predicted AlkP superfamily phosphohydrolase/phosphomutase